MVAVNLVKGVGATRESGSRVRRSNSRNPVFQNTHQGYQSIIDKVRSAHPTDTSRFFVNGQVRGAHPKNLYQRIKEPTTPFKSSAKGLPKALNFHSLPSR
jgi:hypothetical protein